MRRSGGPRIAIFLQGEKEPPMQRRASALTLRVVARLRKHGAQVDLTHPESGVVDIAAICPAYDLYVLKDKTPLILSLAATLALSGARLINSLRSSVIARDKIATTALLAAAGLPVPASWTTGKAKLLASILSDGPIWLKPQSGSRGIGVRRLVRSMELDALDATDRYGLPLPLFAQEEVPSDGRDFKVYVVGDQVWGLRRDFPAVTLEQKLGKVVDVPSSLKNVALACGRALGLELFGVDFLVDGGKFFVVDVNAFPGYKGINDAPASIADYLYGKALATGPGAALTEIAR